MRPKEFELRVVIDRELADFLVDTVIGLSSMARAGQPQEKIVNYVNIASQSLD